MTSGNDDPSDDELIDHFLQGTSRTFALAIPLLNDQRRRQIGLSYLLFRIADSIEDAPDTDAEVKNELLLALRYCFGMPHAEHALPSHFQGIDSIHFIGLWPEHSPTGRLLQAFPRLMAIFESLPSSVSRVIGRALTSTVTGMNGFIETSKGLPNQIHIQTLNELRLYCYVVAGIVGEMLTDIFVCHHPIEPVVRRELRRLSVGFGEFLQLINILKDSSDDAAGGRLFIPIEAPRERIYELAMAGRDQAQAYVRLLESNDFPSDIVGFCRFLFLLADGSLQKLRHGGAGSKLTRAEVMQLLSKTKSEVSVLRA